MQSDSPWPMATYRLQLNRSFRFADAQDLVPYFSRLGVTHIYASPILRARQSSLHGYDVVDPKTINPNLGDKTNLISLATELRKLGLGIVLDIVPNHMAASLENPYWRDVLTYGPSSPFASWFDIDWRMPDPNMWGRVLLPVLGEPRSQVIKNSQIRLIWEDGRFLIRYFDHLFPVDPASVPTICEFGMEDLKKCLEENPFALDTMNEILGHLLQLPIVVNRLRRRVNIDREETEQWLARFAQLVMQSPRIQNWAEATAELFGQGPSGNVRLAKLLDKQPYRLVHWRDAARIINYRRFFDINELVSVRQEDPRVFDETHTLLSRWIDEGLISGVRVDHIDGLRDPEGYLDRLDEMIADCQHAPRQVPIFVEKILAPGEQLPHDWPVAGTTGYDFLNQVEPIFISLEGFGKIEDYYHRLIRQDYAAEHYSTLGKRRVLRNEFSAQIDRLSDLLERLSIESRRSSSPPAVEADDLEETSPPEGEQSNSEEHSDPTSNTSTPGGPGKRDLINAIVETITAMGVYRTYIDNRHRIVSEADQQTITAAIAQARTTGRASSEALDFLEEVLLLKRRELLSEHTLSERVTFIQRFQQVSGPAAAKGVEDTAHYVYVPLASLCEVGGEPKIHSSDPLEELHRSNLERLQTWPGAMLSATTHDTKRTADVRARLDVLSEFPDLWIESLNRWESAHGEFFTDVGGKPAPDPVTRYLFYQTLIGVWPAENSGSSTNLPEQIELQDLSGRIEAYMLKAAREAKTQTTWTNQNQQYESALSDFIRRLLLNAEAASQSFLKEVRDIVSRISIPGFWNSLSRSLVQFTAPGTPDLYQGDELWNFSLVDPDNRRPVNFQARQNMLNEIITHFESPEEQRRDFLKGLVLTPQDGRIKLHVIRSALTARRDHPHLFAAGEYLPLSVRGLHKHRIFAFARLSPTNTSQSAEPSPADID
ncbi:MAG: hypothetical protein KDA36_03955, partial [Planctomycetaceae bacterium]|nr:hypothetical protein [Planctomycetaceae bacterium]